MSEITLTIPDSSMRALKLSPEAFARELKLVAAIKLFELGKLSSGAAADLAGIPRTVFLSKLGDYGVDTFRMTKDEIISDLENV